MISALAVAAGSVVAGVGSVGIGRDRLRTWYYALPDDGAGRPLSEGYDRTLARVAETLLDVPVEPAHYEEFFRWRAEHLPGRRAFYERLASNLDELARGRAGRRFDDCDVEVRRVILTPVHRLREGRASMEHAGWGEEHSGAATERFLRDSGVRYERIEEEGRLVERVVDHLRTGKVVGWSQGRFEWGPRALGHRSILADPRRSDMKDIVNTKIKFREPFRPFAPSVLVEEAEKYFDLPEAARHYPARFMLYVVDVKDNGRASLPAITHVDGTGRLQTVRRDLDRRYYRLIEAFGEATGVPVLLNTSFNLKGEPIVNTPAEAFNTFRASGMDVLVLGDCLITKGSDG